MISLLIYLLIILLIFGAILYAIRVFPLDPPFKNIAYIVILIVFIIVLLSLIGVIPGGPWPRVAA